MIRAVLTLLAALVLGQPAEAASTINTLPPVVNSPGTYPLPDSGCAATSTQNLWIAQENASPKDDFKIIPEMAGYIHQGNTAPSCPFKYQLWWDTTNNPRVLKAYTGSAWASIGYMDDVAGLWISSPGTGNIASIASSTATDLCQAGTLPQGTVFVTGNATITSFGTSCPVGTIKNVIWTGAATITNGTPISVSGGVTKTVTPGDVWQLSYQNVGSWRQFYQQPGQQNVGRVTNLVGTAYSVLELQMTADTVSVGSSLGGSATVVPSFSQIWNSANGGAGGMDTGAGTAPANSFVAVYAITGPSGISTVGYTCNASCPTIYPGSNMPSGYINSALLVVWPTNAAKHPVAGRWAGKRFQYGGVSGGPLPALDHSTAPTTSPGTLSLTGFVPPPANAVRGTMSLTVTTYGGGYPFLRILSQPDQSAAQNTLQSYTASAASLSPPGVLSGNYDLLLTTPQQISYQTSSDIAAGLTASIYVNGYTIP